MLLWFNDRYLGKLKSYVRNKANPEGSIAEGYRFEEILTFCSRYLENIETRWNQPGRVDDDPIDDIQTASRVAELFPRVGKPVGGSSYYTLTPTEKLQTHRHVLTNCPIVDDYLKYVVLLHLSSFIYTINIFLHLISNNQIGSSEVLLKTK